MTEPITRPTIAVLAKECARDLGVATAFCTVALIAAIPTYNFLAKEVNQHEFHRQVFKPVGINFQNHNNSQPRP